jgi:signal transduction histidine kinase
MSAMNATMRETAAAARRFTQGSHWAPALGLILTVIAVVEASIGSDPSDRGVVMAVALGATAPIAYANRRPVLMGAIVTACVLAMLAGTVPLFGSAVIAETVALYLVASRTRRLVSAVFALPFVLNAMFPMGGDDAATSGVLLLVLAVGALAFGDARRLWGQAIAERDASRQQVADTLHEQVAMEERARIARELHDVVAHHVSMIAVQAETARLTTPELPEEGRERFGEIADSARDALAQMRQLLGVLREDAGGGGERAPQPGLANLDELIAEARATGTRVGFALSGSVVPLSPGADLAAFRIVQEALTNARRHAPEAVVDVEVRYVTDAVHIVIRDDGPGPDPQTPDGNGLRGMRERAAMVGGALHTGQAEGGGFLIEATFPIGGTPDEATA